MSLIKNHSLTDKNLAARRSNGKKSLGAATQEGKERARASNLRHGYYSKARDEALRALGEDPADLAALIDSTRRDWRSASGFQAQMAERLARLLWRMERAERLQQSLAAQHVLRRQKRRREAAEELRDRCELQTRPLELMVEDGTDPRFYTPRGCFYYFLEACGKYRDEKENEILRLMTRLRKPPSWEEKEKEEEKSALSVGQPCAPGAGNQPGIKAATPSEAAGEPVQCSRPQMRRDGAIGDGAVLESCGSSPGAVAEACPLRDEAHADVPLHNPPAGEEPEGDPYIENLAEWDQGEEVVLPEPDLEVAEGEERDVLRLELVERAKYELEIVKAAWKEKLAEVETPLTALELDELQSKLRWRAELMRREEESCFRQFVRLGNFLMKFQDHSEKLAKNAGPSGDLDENKGSTEPAPPPNGSEPVAAVPEVVPAATPSLVAGTAARLSPPTSSGLTMPETGEH